MREPRAPRPVVSVSVHGVTGETAVVRKRDWVSFAPGEIRVCTNCHGLNYSGDVVVRQPAATHSPAALAGTVDFNI